MTSRPWGSIALPALCAAVTLVTTGAWADDKAACLDAASEGQRLRDAQKLVGARDKFRTCAAARCPAVVQGDCAGWLAEVEKSLPTIVFEAEDPAGKDLTAVAVSMDGVKMATSLTGAALPVDPGPHTFTFEVAGQAPAVLQLVVHEGEKARTQRVVIGGPAPGSAPASTGRLVIAGDSEATVAVDGKVVGKGRFEGVEASGPHEVSVSETGMRPYRADIDLRPGETRTLQVTLEAEHRGAIWPWIVGGAAVAAGAVVGGYFLFKSSTEPAPNPPGSLGSVRFAAWGVR